MSFLRYPAYKDSGVEWLGEVPEHWEVKRLRNVSTLNPSKSEISNLDRDTEVSFLPMEAVGDDGTLVLDRTRPIIEVDSGYTYFREGDVTIAKITPCFENGKGAVMRGLQNGHGFGTTELIVVRPSEGKTSSNFLHCLFTSHPFRQLGEAAMYGAGGQKRVPDDFVRDFAVAFPPLAEQSAITSFLNHETAKIDALVAEQERLIELLKEKRQAVISHAVTKGLNPSVPMKDSGVEWLDEVPAHWEVAQFRRYVAIAEGQVNPEEPPYASMVLIAPNHVESSTGRVVALETAAEQGAESGKYVCSKGDVIYSKIRPALRKVCIAPVDCLCSADMYPLKPHSGLTSDYLLWYMLSDEFSTLAVLESERVAMPKINRETLNPVVIVVPPDSEQRDIAAHLSAVTGDFDRLMTEATVAVELLQERRTALISAAVTGQIDVRGWAPTETAH